MDTPGALSGLRILDLSWVVAGPYATRILADQGAEVIKVEPPAALGLFTGRHVISETDAFAPVLRGHFNNLNRGKLSITLNLREPKGREVARKLAQICDVVVDNYSADVMKRWDLDYAALSRLNKKIVVIHMAGFGHTGPWRDYVSYALNMMALCGMTDLTGFSDHGTMGMAVGYPDYAAGLTASLAILIAVEHRQRTGQGQEIDLSQHEALCSLLGPLALDLSCNGIVRRRTGNRPPYASAVPQGVYRCKGDDRWCAIAVSGSTQWQALCDAMGKPPWTTEDKWSTIGGRLRHVDELDKLVEDWTLQHLAEDVMGNLQRRGVPAAVVQNGEDLFVRDPQLRSRGFYEEADHPVVGRRSFEGVPFKLSLTPGRIRRAAPLLGEHNDYVYTELLGMSEHEVNQYIVEGVI